MTERSTIAKDKTSQLASDYGIRFPMRMSCRANNGVLNPVYEHWKKQRDHPPETLSMDNTIEKVPLVGRRGALKTASSSVRKSCGGENARVPMLVGKERAMR